MENLEKYIRSNIDSFDEKEPMDGHFDRFRQKLEIRKPTQRVNLFMVAAAAAVAGIILTGTLGLLFNSSSLNNFNAKELTLSVLSPELKEVENYYQSQINSRYNQINTLSKNSSPDIKTEVSRVINDMDLGYYLLKKDLDSNPKQERIVNAMIQQYQVRIDMLDQILKTLEKVKNISNLNN
jgi:hypothetical protein